MKTNRAVGLDKIGARLLKDSVDVITPSLTNLEIIVNFNKMLVNFSTVLCTVFILNTHPINRLSKAGAAVVNTISSKILERFSITFTANGKRQAEISRLPKTREIYLVSAYILPVSHSYGASTKNREIS